MTNIFQRHDLKRLDFIVLVTFLGVIANLADYGYGIENHISKLPPILRQLDSSYLINDFYVNTTAEFGPLSYFARSIAFFSALAPLHVVALCLTLLASGLVALITFLFARDLFEGSNLAGVLAVCIVMSIDRNGPIGEAAIIYDRIMLPGGLVMPFILLAVWAALKQKPIICASLTGAASIIHPLMGMGTGGILLTTIVVTQASLMLHRNPQDRAMRLSWRAITVSTVVLAAFAALSLIPYSSSERISSAQFFEIMAYLRNPHHYIPSTFGEIAYISALSMLFAFSIAWYWWQTSIKVSEYRVRFVAILTLFILMLLLGGYFFVEIIPMRIWVTAQVFRFVFLIRWIGFVLVGGVIAYWLTVYQSNLHAGLFLVSTVSPITLGITHVSKLLENQRKEPGVWVGIYLQPSPIMMVVIIVLLLTKSDVIFQIMLLALLSGIILAFAYWPKKVFYTAMGATLVILTLTGCFRQEIELPAGIKNTVVGKLLKPQISLDDFSDPASEVASYAREHTPKDSVFLTPPSFGQFRLTAQRAIVVDFKAFPFQDKAMVEWRQRLFDCYGEPDTIGFPALKEMETNYALINDARIRTLQAKYGFFYVVLNQQTPTRYPNLYENRYYKIIQVVDQPSYIF
ncbi:MAG: hypothetical protein KDJ97_36030 [Anaerolineae bacterium]|nr:hypothetical protein [Anaerolineae bacterium]